MMWGGDGRARSQSAICSVFLSFFSLFFIPFHFRLCTDSPRQTDFAGCFASLRTSPTFCVFPSMSTAMAVSCRLAEVTGSGRCFGDGAVC